MASDLRRLFEQGLYEKVLETSTSPGDSELQMENYLWQMAAALFLGDWERGQSTHKKILKETQDLSLLQPDLKVRLYYFLGLAALRRSGYKKAAQLFSKSLDLKKQNQLSSEALFFANQGPALFHYFHGQFDRARKWGERAFAEADAAGFDWGELLSRDLLAHAYFHLGQVRRSQDYFSHGLRLAKKLHNPALEAAMKISSLKYAASAALEAGPISLGKLQAALKELSPHDSYSHIELYLEIARQQSLLGRQQEAEASLNQALPMVHKFQNKRQMARLNFRLAHIEYLRGRDLSALGLLRSGQVLLENKMDLSVLEEFRGLEHKILKEDKRFDEGEALSPKAHSSYWDLRIRSREGGLESPLPRGEDPLGDILDLLATERPRAIQELLSLGYLGLLPQALDLKRGQDAILLGLTSKGLCILHEGSLWIREKGLTALLGKLLVSLARGPQSKKTLIEKIWGYSYESSRHDPLLYKAVASLRKLLSPFEDWIQFDAEFYGLRRGVEIRSFDQNFNELSLNSIDETLSSPQPVSSRDLGVDGRLNHRQNMFLKSWPRHKPIGIDEYAAKFQISKASATRDLTGLVDTSYVLRLGKARATKYIR